MYWVAIVQVQLRVECSFVRDCLRGDDEVDVLMTSFEVPGVSGLELCWEARLIAQACRPLYVIASGAPGFDLAKGFAANGYGEHSPGRYSLVACFLAEVVLTLLFLFVIMGATHGKAPVGFAPLAIGLCLTLVHLVGIPITNLSVNPARSTGPALIVGGWAVAQLWLFWVGPVIGAVLAGIVYRWVGGPNPDETEVSGDR